MKLSVLLENISCEIIQGNLDIEIRDINNDSRLVDEGSVFVCIPGAVSDGHDYIEQVIAEGVSAIVVEKDVKVQNDITVIRVESTRYALALMSASFYGNPAQKMKVIGITGTKGKTTTTYMVKEILEGVGKKVGLVGTIEVLTGNRQIPAANTTPESIQLQQYFLEMYNAGCEYVVMEVSSQGLMLHRTAGIHFELGIFTNLGEDHIGDNEHRDFTHYMECKRMLFDQCKLAIANGDDNYYQEMFADVKCPVKTFGFKEGNDFRATDIELINKPGYLGTAYQVKGLLNMAVEIDVPGRFSIYNSLTAMAVCKHFGVANDEIVKSLKVAKVKGRIEIIPVSDEFTVMIDYAHNAMSLESMLSTLKEYKPSRIVTLFGCGGNRAKGRRYEMGEVSGNLSDLTIITSDNPRYESPQEIIEDIKYGMAKTSGAYVEIIDRKEAIKYAIEHAQIGDVIILAGKGHETYQEIAGVKHHMDERELIQEVLVELSNS